MENLSAADSNNFEDSVGAGEREGRIACPLVGRLHFGLAPFPEAIFLLYSHFLD